jgi:hypothetical protein
VSKQGERSSSEGIYREGGSTHPVEIVTDESERWPDSRPEASWRWLCEFSITVDCFVALVHKHVPSVDPQAHKLLRRPDLPGYPFCLGLNNVAIALWWVFVELTNGFSSGENYLAGKHDAASGFWWMYNLFWRLVEEWNISEIHRLMILERLCCQDSSENNQGRLSVVRAELNRHLSRVRIDADMLRALDGAIETLRHACRDGYLAHGSWPTKYRRIGSIGMVAVLAGAEHSEELRETQPLEKLNAPTRGEPPRKRMNPGSKALAAAHELWTEGRPVSLLAACLRAGVDRKNVKRRYPDEVRCIRALAAPDRAPHRGVLSRRTGHVDGVEETEE